MADRGEGVKEPHCKEDDVVSQSLDAIFEPFGDCDDPVECHNAIIGLTNLVGVYFEKHAKPLLKNKAIQCDSMGASEAIKRFQRDVFGVYRFQKLMQELEFSTREKDIVLHEAGKLGIRINSGTPLKTRIAASFSLWMTTFRPISINPQIAVQFYKLEQLRFCNAVVTHYISCAFLRQYGKVDHGIDEDADKRLERLRYDFTYRDLNLSALEMLYCSLYRPRESKAVFASK